MIPFIARRIVHSVPILLGVSLIVFLLAQLMPGDPVDFLLPPEASPELLARVKAAYGFDQPLYIQYLRWLARSLSGDLGISIYNSQPVSEQLFAALFNTALLAFPAAFIGYALGILLGLLSVRMKGGRTERVFNVIAAAGVSVPSYWLAIILVLVFAVLGVASAVYFLPGGHGWPSAFAIVAGNCLWLFGFGLISPGATDAAISPFPDIAGAASALQGFAMMGSGALVSVIVSRLATSQITLAASCALLTLAGAGLLRIAQIRP